MRNDLPAAVLFDMDGTLVDTERLWVAAVAEVADDLGRPLTPEDKPHVLGRPAAYTAAHLLATSELGLGESDLRARLNAVFTESVRQEIVPRPGATALVAELSRAGIPAAIVSASPRHVVELVRDALGRDRFELVIGEEDTVRSKPAPDPYLAAAAALGVDPACCVAVEDSPVGTIAAEAAGCVVLVVPSVAPVAPAARRTIVDSLEGVDLAVLRRLVSGVPIR